MRSSAASDVYKRQIQNIEGVSGLLAPAIRYIVAILVFLIGKSIAGGIKKLIEKGLGKTEIDNKLATMIGGDATSAEKAIAGFIYGILLLFVVIFALQIAEITMLLNTLNVLLGTFLGAIPKIIQAGIVLYLGSILAKIVKGLVLNVLSAAKIDERLGLSLIHI